MEKFKKLKNMPAKVKKRLTSALLLLCTIATFAAPAFGGGFSAMKPSSITSSAAAIEDVDLVLVAASAFGEARKSMNATDTDKQDIFISNTEKILRMPNGIIKWQNIGLLIGAREALSGTTWNAYQSPSTLSGEEVLTYDSDIISESYNKYKAFGYAVQNLNNKAQKSYGTSVSAEEGLDALSTAAVKMGSFGVDFLNKYNPGPILISFYDSSNLSKYPDNEFVKIVRNHDPLYEFVKAFGDPVAGTGLSFFLIFNAVIAIVGFALSMFLILMGNRSFGDSIKKFILRIVIGAAGIYIVGNVLSFSLDWVDSTIGGVTSSGTSQYVEDNLNLYDWYLTGFQLPDMSEPLKIDASGNFVFTQAQVRAINTYTYNRLYGSATDEAMRKKMENYTQSSNIGTASYITPTQTAGEDTEGWNSDMYYAYMGVYAQNIDLGEPDDFGVDSESPIYGQAFTGTKCKYTNMSNLKMDANGDGWDVYNHTSSDNFYGLNPISALNLVRSDFSGNGILATSTVYPKLAYVAFDISGTPGAAANPHMNALTRFIACFTLVLATLKGFFTIITAGFAGLLAGGVRTSTGSAGGLGQALGGVIALIGGILGISLIMSMTLSLLDVVYGIAVSLVGDVDVLESFLTPILDALPGFLHGIIKGGAEFIMSLILMFSFPKMGGIPITMFSQWISELPSRLSEKAMQLENMLLSGRGAGGGLGGHAGSGGYGKRAQAMAGQAFSSGTRSAMAALGGGWMAAKALGGAALTAGGKALNKKADALEGKGGSGGSGGDGFDTSNIPGYDDLSDEDKAKAAALAEEMGEDWNGMSDEERQDLMNERGIGTDSDAETSSTSKDADSDADPNAVKNDVPVDNVKTDVSGTKPEMSSDDPSKPQSDQIAESLNPAVPIADTEGRGLNDEKKGVGDGKQLTDQAEDAGNKGKAPEEEHIPDKVEQAPAGQIQTPTDSSVSGTPAAEPEEEVSQDELGTGELGSGGSGDPEIEGPTINQESVHQEGDHVQEQQNALNQVTAEQRQHVEAKDASNTSISDQTIEKEDGQSYTDMYNSDGTPVTSTKGTPDIPGSGLNPYSADSGGTGPAGTPASQLTKVHNDAANAEKLKNERQKVPVTKGQSAAAMQRDTAKGQHPKEQSTGKSSAATGSQNKAGQNKGSMNKTSKPQGSASANLKNEKKARFLHALGDGMQMAGGNRTMKQGLKDAMSYAKDGLVTAAMPDEMQNLAGYLRTKRMERNQKEMMNQRRNPDDKK